MANSSVAIYSVEMKEKEKKPSLSVLLLGLGLLAAMLSIRCSALPCAFVCVLYYHVFFFCVPCAVLLSLPLT